jgi:hypothetical protein
VEIDLQGDFPAREMINEEDKRLQAENHTTEEGKMILKQ